MKFTKKQSGHNAEWKAVTENGTFFISKYTSPYLGNVSYEVTVTFEDGGMKYLGERLQYLRDAKALAEAF